MRTIWNQELDELLKEKYPKCESVNKLSEELNIPKRVLYNRAALLGIKRESNIGYQNVSKNGKSTQFKKGYTPWNKGLKNVMKPNRKSFKRGHTPHNAIHFGKPHINTRTRKNGKMEKTWFIQPLGSCKKQSYTRYLWEQEYGEIPKGNIITFKNGFVEDRIPTIDDLKMISRGNNLNRNTGCQEIDEHYTKLQLKKSGINNPSEELIKLKQIYLKTNRKIKEHERNCK